MVDLLKVQLSTEPWIGISRFSYDLHQIRQVRSDKKSKLGKSNWVGGTLFWKPLKVKIPIKNLTSEEGVFL